jgi:hypothetical protein
MSGLVVLLVHVSKSPVRRCPTFTDPPSKHWLQLLVAKVEFELQFTAAYSQAEDPDEGLTVDAAFMVVVASVVAAVAPVLSAA